MSKRKLARSLRRQPTPSEALAWQMLRNRKCLGLKFRRQQPIRGYVVDFYCAELRFALEIDGSVHWREEAFVRNLQRDEHLEKHGVRVLHIRPRDVPHLQQILTSYLTPRPPLPRGRGGRGVRSQEVPDLVSMLRSNCAEAGSAPSRLRTWVRRLAPYVIALVAIGVILNSSQVLVPHKSASRLVGLGPGYTARQVESACRFCPRRETCWRRH